MSKLYTEEEIEILKYEEYDSGFDNGKNGSDDERNGKYEYICKMSNDNKLKKKIYNMFIKDYIDEHIKDYYKGDAYDYKIKEMYEEYPLE